jgi:ABC-type transport system involved in cytochrome c biogenesis permease subunit
MTSMLHSGGWVFYLAAAIAYFAYLVSPRPWLGRLATAILAMGFAGHTVCFIVQATGAGIPFASKALVLSLFAWGIVGLYLGSQLLSKMTVLGAFVAPVATVMALLSEAAPGAPEAASANPTFWLYAHITMMVLGYAAFSVSFGVAVIYLIQERFLKARRLSGLFRKLPSLDALDRLNQRAIVVGFILLSAGLFLGAAWATIRPRPEYRMWVDPQFLLAAVLWVWYAFAVQSRLFGGWRGRKSAFFAVVGFFALLVTFVGLTLASQSFHLFAAAT